MRSLLPPGDLLLCLQAVRGTNRESENKNHTSSFFLSPNIREAPVFSYIDLKTLIQRYSIFIFYFLLYSVALKR